jgi:hypothetical protein
MKKYYAILSFSLFISACSPNKPTDNKGVVKDSTVSVSSSGNSFPILVTDSSMKDSFPLSSSFLKKYVLPQIDKINENWTLNDFLKIDSLKTAGKYKEYVEHLDIGQTKESSAWIYDTLSDVSGKVIVWGITYSSYEACPSFSGKNIFITTISQDDKYQNTIKLLEISGFADPPVYSSITGQCILNADLSIACMDSLMYGEYIDPSATEKGYDETTRSTCTRKYKIENDGRIKELENKKSPEKKERIYAKEN